MNDAIFSAAIFMLLQIGLAIFLTIVFIRLRIVERDTRLDEEQGKQPLLEVKGAGCIDRSGWSRNPFCRLSLYDDYLVASVKSTRKCFRYAEFSDVGIRLSKERKLLYMHGPELDGELRPNVEFILEEAETVLEQLESRMKVARKSN